MAKPCLFCAVAAGEAEASTVWSDADFVAFLDIRPLFKGHVLLVPRLHVVTLPDLGRRRWSTDWGRRARSWR